MNWAILIPIIAQYGLPLAEKLWQKWASKGEPTQDDWNELRALAAQTARTQLIAALERGGVPLDSDQAKNLLDLLNPS